MNNIDPYDRAQMKQDFGWEVAAHYLDGANFKPYSYKQFEQAFWHLWLLNCYHVTGSFDVSMTLLLDWALQYHLDFKK